jgi:hypothetical protein
LAPPYRRQIDYGLIQHVISRSVRADEERDRGVQVALHCAKPMPVLPNANKRFLRGKSAWPLAAWMASCEKEKSGCAE